MGGMAPSVTTLLGPDGTPTWGLSPPLGVPFSPKL